MTPPAAAILIALALAASGAARPAAAHPQDGPHADVRIAVDEQAVSFQITLNLVFADSIVTVVREDMSTVHEVEMPQMAEALLDYFRTHNRVTVDGVDVGPLARSFEVDDPDLAMLPLFPLSGLRGLQRVKIVLDYPVKSMPASVTMVWGPYPRDVLLSTPTFERTLEIAAELTASGIDTIVVFTREEPEYTWHNLGTTPEERFLPVPETAEARGVPMPLVSIGLLALLVVGAVGSRLSGRWSSLQGPVLVATPIVLIAAASTLGVARMELSNPFAPGMRLPSDEAALGIFAPLHANIYRAFDYNEPGDVYDALARSVDGELLDALYNQVYQSLIMHEEGGAVSRVQAVRPISTEVQAIGLIPPGDDVGFQVLARWQVDGTVVHWGHSHKRTNEYEAQYTVKGTPGGWRIAASQVLEQFRVEPETPDTVLPPGTEL